MAEKRHTIGGNDGWLNVKREPGGEIVALPEYLQVEFSHNRDGREFFEVGPARLQACCAPRVHHHGAKIDLARRKRQGDHGARNWFYLGRAAAIRGGNERYLHTGRVSLGCVTVDPVEWTKVYQYLILCRSGDGKTVGSIVVRR
jgi:hypothetical protein